MLKLVLLAVAAAAAVLVYRSRDEIARYRALSEMQGIGVCLGIPGEVITLLGGDLAMVAVEGVERPVNVGMLTPEEAVPGLWVLVHLGFAMEVIDRAEAESSLNFVTGAADWDPH